MKRKLFMVTALVLLVLASGFAEGTTWSNPNDILFGTYYNVPRSMISAVSNGIYYDEIDTIILSAAQVSNYEGFSIVTGYGNYEFDYSNAIGTGDTDYHNIFLNPFTTVASNNITQGGVNDELGNFLLGVTGELFGFRGGVIGSFEFDNEGDLNIESANDSYYTEDYSQVVDADGDGTVDYTYTYAETYTDYYTQGTFRLGAVVDLDFVVASLYSVFSNRLAFFGGNAVYSHPTSADADQGDVDNLVTSQVSTYGNKEEGAVGMDPDDTWSNWLFGVRGHLPLEIADISMPVKFDLNLGSQTPGTIGIYNPKKTVNITTRNLLDVAATPLTNEDKTNTITASYGATTVSNWNAQTDAGVSTLGATPQYTAVQFRALTDDIADGTLNYALDPDDFSDSNFMAGFEGIIDPEIVVADVFSVRTRGQLGYMFDMTKTNNAGLKSVTYRESVEASDTQSVYSFTESIVSPSTDYTNMIDIELGGLMDLHNEEGTLSVACGLFYHPTITLESTVDGATVHTIAESWTDASGTDADIADPWPVYTPTTIGPGYAQGVYNYSETIATADGTNDTTNTYMHNFYIPASTRVKFAKGALELVGGYLLNHSATTTVTTTYTNNTTSTETEAITNSTGAALTAPAASTDASVINPIKTTVKTMTDGGWRGQMSWMLRWHAMEGMTVDLYGETVEQALNFEVFGNAGGTGFNPSTLLGSLGMSVTISAK